MKPTKEQIAQAVAARKEYNDSFARGEEMPYPQWADEIIDAWQAEVSTAIVIAKAKRKD